MPSAGFEPATPAIEKLQTYAVDRSYHDWHSYQLKMGYTPFDPLDKAIICPQG